MQKSVGTSPGSAALCNIEFSDQEETRTEQKRDMSTTKGGRDGKTKEQYGFRDLQQWEKSKSEVTIVLLMKTENSLNH